MIVVWDGESTLIGDRFVPERLFVDIEDVRLEVAQAMMNDGSSIIVAYGATMLGPEPMTLRAWATEHVLRRYCHASRCGYRVRDGIHAVCTCALRDRLAVAWALGLEATS